MASTTWIGGVRGPAHLPLAGVALLGVAEDSRPVRMGDPFLELDGKGAQHLPRQAERRKTRGR